MSLDGKNRFAATERKAFHYRILRSSSATAVLLGLLVFLISTILWSLTGRSGGVFLTRFMRGFPIRLSVLLVTTACVSVPVAALSRILSFASRRAQGGLLGQLVKIHVDTPVQINKSDMYLLRPLQGIALSMILTDRLHQVLELSGETGFSRFLTRMILPILGNLLVSLLLSTTWTLDDLGLRFYFKKTGEVRTAGSSVGVILPVITGILSAAGLYWDRTLPEALLGIVGIVLPSYPVYLFLTTIHHEVIKRRATKLLRQLSVAEIETELT